MQGRREYHILHWEIWGQNLVLQLCGAHLNWHSWSRQLHSQNSCLTCRGRILKLSWVWSRVCDGANKIKVWFCRVVFLLQKPAEASWPCGCTAAISNQEKWAKDKQGEQDCFFQRQSTLDEATREAHAEIWATKVWHSGSTQSWCRSGSPASWPKRLEKKL